MLLAGRVFPKEDLRVMSTFEHSFLGGFDAKGNGRVIEPSALTLDRSYFGIPKKPIFEGTVFGKQEVIFQLPLELGLSIDAGQNYSNRLDPRISLTIKHHLLALSYYLGDSLWYNLSNSFLNQNARSLNWLLARTRAGVINDRYFRPFYYLIGDVAYLKKAFSTIKANLSQEQVRPSSLS